MSEEEWEASLREGLAEYVNEDPGGYIYKVCGEGAGGGKRQGGFGVPESDIPHAGSSPLEGEGVGTTFGVENHAEELSGGGRDDAPPSSAAVKSRARLPSLSQRAGGWARSGA